MDELIIFSWQLLLVPCCQVGGEILCSITLEVLDSARLHLSKANSKLIVAKQVSECPEIRFDGLVSRFEVNFRSDLELGKLLHTVLRLLATIVTGLMQHNCNGSLSLWLPSV